MTRAIKASAKTRNKSFCISAMNVEIKATFEGLTQQEINERVHRMKNGIHDYLREFYFNVSEIKIK